MQTRERLLALRAAVDYLRAYQGQIFVMKLGGRLCEPGKALDSLAEQLALLHQLGIRVVVVHGGGEQTSRTCRRLGIEPRIVAGRRITDEATLDVAKMMMAGTVNTDLLAALQRAGAPAVGISGVDGGLLKAARRPVQRVNDPDTGESRLIDFGLVGDIESVQPQLLTHLQAGGYLPVVCSLAGDGAGGVLNINADTVAAQLAVVVKAAKYVLVSTVDGVLSDAQNPATLLTQLDVADLDALIERGAITGGMLPKLAACRAALSGGVPRVHVINGLTPDAILAEVFTNEGCGTLIVPRRDGAASTDATARPGAAAATVKA